MTFDIIVVGLGAMGSSAAYHLAKRRARVLGLDRFSIPNEMGSSHGETRIIRLAYAEDPRYVPLLRRAFELWRALEQESGTDLLHLTGCLNVGAPDSTLVDGVQASCRHHDLAHEELSAPELMRRFPAWRLPPDVVGIFEPQGGYLLSEKCIETHARLAAQRGADLRAGTAVIAIESAAGNVRVTTATESFDAARVVVTAGSWNPTLMADVAPFLAPQRTVATWVAGVDPELFAPARFPVFLAELDGASFYGVPQHSARGLKAGVHDHSHSPIDPDRVDRRIHADDEDRVRDFIGRHLPAADGHTIASSVCLYTNSPDENFILDVHPTQPNVVIGAGFSGHGFKFASVVGEVLADLALDGGTRHDIEFLRLRRFAPQFMSH